MDDFSPYSFWHFSFSISQYLIFTIKKISQSLKKSQLHLACMMKYQVWGGLRRAWHRLSVLFSISCLLPLEILTSHFFLAPAWLRMTHLVVINSWHPKKLCFLNILQFASVDPLWSSLADFWASTSKSRSDSILEDVSLPSVSSISTSLFPRVPTTFFYSCVALYVSSPNSEL